MLIPTRTSKVVRAVLCSAFAFACASGCGETSVGTATRPWASCSVNSQCVIAANSCCGTCGEPSVDNVDGVNAAHLDEHLKAVCPAPVPCPKCATQDNPDLHATCAEGSCRALDIRKDETSACARDEDCRLRVKGCCECGGSTAVEDLIAVNVSQEFHYAGLVCDPMQACAECAPVYPASVEAYCGGDGHCDVRQAMPSLCLLPFESGPCLAYMPVFAFVDGACVERVYGGCDGNDNRFASMEECWATCAGPQNPDGCPPDRVYRNICLSCGPAGGCGKQAEVCAKVCASDSDCSGALRFCTNGACAVGGCE